MKEFFSIKSFKEIKVLFILEFIMGLLLAMLISINKSSINYWSWKAFLITIMTWLLSSALDKEKYWNLGTLIIAGSFLYLLWWFVFNLQIS